MRTPATKNSSSLAYSVHPGSFLYIRTGATGEEEPEDRKDRWSIILRFLKGIWIDR